MKEYFICQKHFGLEDSFRKRSERRFFDFMSGIFEFLNDSFGINDKIFCQEILMIA